MIHGVEAVTRTGMPEVHGRVFQGVANHTNCVIASREVGKWATGLLLESYATKGFHNKAKSCPWGPMAGFVLADPRFTKNPDLAGQRGALGKAIQHGGDEIPLWITDERRRDLEGPLGRISRVGGNINEMVYEAGSPEGSPMKFVLRRDSNAPGAHGRTLWAVFYARGESRMSNDLKSLNKADANSGLLPVMAMVDPACAASVRNTYRAATTGDYDLWAVFPKRENFSAKGMDARMVPGSERFAQPLKAYAAENPDRGNLTQRIAQIRYQINQGVKAHGYEGGDVVHHSDEAGRPMVTSIDFPCVAFVPNKGADLIASVGDLKTFIAQLGHEYVMALNPGWQRQLGIDVSAGGSYVV